ncbi:MAG: glucose-1-phosphate adenylyltransferase [Lachnospiraceae bacterium]|jgi:glucose-1-phosphate adenylyltransferase|nr:glucose-1-phosphate adenylyltransferase [Lachnospiraceae bacterium]
MENKEVIAMLLAGGQGSRLGVLTQSMAKPAVPFGGKYRIIDFPLSNCVNSGIDTVGVLTQYQPLELNAHIGIGIPWDLDVNNGGVTVLPPYEKSGDTSWYTGTANAIYQNLAYMESYHPEYVIILSGDHIYKMDYAQMLDFHKENKAQITIAAMPVPMHEASRFGICIADEDFRIIDFEEKPEKPRSNLASMGIYIFDWEVLKDALIRKKDQSNCDFGKHIIPYCFKQNMRIFAYKFDAYWKDVGTLSSYWEANMELIDIVPEFNLYDESWKTYTNASSCQPTFYGTDSSVYKCIIGEGSDIDGDIENSVLGVGVTVEKGAKIVDSIIMSGTHVGADAQINKAIIAEKCEIGAGCRIGVGINTPNAEKPSIYNSGIATIGQGSVIPPGVTIGKNTAILGETTLGDYEDKCLPSGRNIIKAGE